MKRTRIIGLAIVAVFAMSAVASASAALPEFSKFPAKFTSVSGESILKTANGTEVICSSDTNEGETTGGKTDTVVVKFKGCKSSGFACQSGSVEGEIVTNKLKSLIGYINKSKKEVGLDLSPESSEIFVEFNCLFGIVKVKTKGSVIGKITPVDTPTEKFSLVFNYSGTPCKQEIEKFEEGSKDTLESSKNGEAYEGACEKSTDTISFKEKVEIKA